LPGSPVARDTFMLIPSTHLGAIPTHLRPSECQGVSPPEAGRPRPLRPDRQLGDQAPLSVFGLALARISRETRQARGLGEGLGEGPGLEGKRAAAVLGRFGDPRAVPALVQALRDPQWYVRQAAATALGAIGDLRAVGALEKASRDSHKAVARAAAAALRAIRR